jgi:hypothetical protein
MLRRPPTRVELVFEKDDADALESRRRERVRQAMGTAGSSSSVERVPSLSSGARKPTKEERIGLAKPPM